MRSRTVTGPRWSRSCAPARACGSPPSAPAISTPSTRAACSVVDDVELELDPAATLVHVRSASRIGRSDFGANRARVEDLRTRLAAAGV